jgi:hypothetical protein
MLAETKGRPEMGRYTWTAATLESGWVRKVIWDRRLQDAKKYLGGNEPRGGISTQLNTELHELSQDLCSARGCLAEVLLDGKDFLRKTGV